MIGISLHIPIVLLVLLGGSESLICLSSPATYFFCSQKDNKEVERNGMENMRHRLVTAECQAQGFLKGPCGCAGCGQEVLEDSDLLRRLGKFKGIIAGWWDFKDFYFFFLPFKVKQSKNSAMSIFYNEKISHKIKGKICLVHIKT